MRTSAQESCILTLHHFFNVIKYHRKAFKPLSEKRKADITDEGCVRLWCSRMDFRLICCG